MPEARITLEVCVDDPCGLAAALSGGADRIELCSALGLGGLTPSPGLMALAAECAVPVLAMIRPRAGGFVWSEPELAVMEADIAATRRAGLAGVVIGASLPDGRLDGAALARLVRAAGELQVTLHRAFDLVPDPDEALETAVALGITRILTSGGARRAADGVAGLARAFARAAGRIGILPGSGITPESLLQLAGLPLREVHASCSVPAPQDARAAAFGFVAPGARRTDAAAVRALRHSLDRFDPAG